MTTMMREIRGSANEPAAAERTATIASISDQDWYVTRTYGCFTSRHARKARRARC